MKKHLRVSALVSPRTWDGHEDGGLDLGCRAAPYGPSIFWSMPQAGGRAQAFWPSSWPDGRVGPQARLVGKGVARAGLDGMAFLSDCYLFPWPEPTHQLLGETVEGGGEGLLGCSQNGGCFLPAFGKGGDHEERITGNHPWSSSGWEVGSKTPMPARFPAPDPSRAHGLRGGRWPTDPAAGPRLMSGVPWEPPWPNGPQPLPFHLQRGRGGKPRAGSPAGGVA